MAHVWTLLTGLTPSSWSRGVGSWLGEAYLLSSRVGWWAVIWFDTHLRLLGAFWGWRLGALSLHSPSALLQPTGAIFFFSFSFFSFFFIFIFLAYKTLGIFRIFFFFPGRHHLYTLPLPHYHPCAGFTFSVLGSRTPRSPRGEFIHTSRAPGFFLIHTFYWSIVDLQCFRGTSRWFSYTNTHYFWNYFPSEVIIRYWL